MKQLEEDLYDGQVLQKLLGESARSEASPAPALTPHKGPQRWAASGLDTSLCSAPLVT